MARKFRLAILGILIALPIIGGLIGVKLNQFQTMADAGAQFVMPPEPVNAAEVRSADWQPRVTTVGSVVAVQGTLLSAEVEGTVRAILFEAGSQVQNGDLLVQLDVDIERTQLHEAEVAAEWARTSLQRAQDLNKSRNISQVDLDEAETKARQTQAQVDYYRALIAKKTLRAPFAGRLGIRRISVGQFLDKGSPVVSLQSLAPVYVEFSLPQQRLGLLAEGLQVAVASDAYPGQAFTGKITAINPEIDPATRSVRVQATLTNPDGRLRPGMFVGVELLLDRTEQRLLIPATAVAHGPFGDSVFVIEPAPASADGKSSLVLHQRPVRLGARQGDFVVVNEGVQAGETLVSTGVFKLREGMTVVIDNRLAPEFSLAPKPDNA